MTKPNVLAEEDEFWAVALHDNTSLHTPGLFPNEADCIMYSCNNVDNDERETTSNQSQEYRLKTYSLPNAMGATATTTSLTVSSLPANDGIMSPLGGQAWHASALLAAYFVLYRQELLENILVDNNQQLNCLELGSGAVGLSGMTLAAVLNKSMTATNTRRDDAGRDNYASIWLTDLANDDEDGTSILRHLKQNVIRNKASCFPHVTVRVEPLDWMDYCRTANKNKDDSVSFSSPLPLPLLDFVFGSELVYTHETAVACAAVVTRLLDDDNPNLVVLILQVMDRPGFESHFLSTFQNNESYQVDIQQPLNAELHEAARLMVASVGNVLGGTLDRFASGACFIKRRVRTIPSNTDAPI